MEYSTLQLPYLIVRKVPEVENTRYYYCCYHYAVCEGDLQEFHMVLILKDTIR